MHEIHFGVFRKLPVQYTASVSIGHLVRYHRGVLTGFGIYIAEGF